jgi:hypothetical protein
MWMGMAAGAPDKRSILELRLLKLRNTQDAMGQRTGDYLGKSYVPALQRAGVSPVAAFGSVIAQETPFILLVTSYPDMNAWDTANQKLAADKQLSKERESFYAGGLGYVRAEVSLLRGFESVPTLEVPAKQDKARIFELRTYESNNPHTLARKVRMFNEGEIAIFRKSGMTPVFFGETIVGRNMPNLTYMLAFDDLASREKAWSAFGSSPEWGKLKGQPGYSDAEIVSNISNSILRPMPFSAIR